MAHNWNYRILATPARTTVKTRLNCLQNSEITAVYGNQYCRVSKKSIFCLINNRTKDFCQNFTISPILVKTHLDLNFETKIVEIR